MKSAILRSNGETKKSRAEMMCGRWSRLVATLVAVLSVCVALRAQEEAVHGVVAPEGPASGGFGPAVPSSVASAPVFPSSDGSGPASLSFGVSVSPVPAIDGSGTRDRDAGESGPDRSRAADGVFAVSASELTSSEVSASAGSGGRFVHRIGVEFRPERILPTHDFLRGANGTGHAIAWARSVHLRYGFRFRPGSSEDWIYRGARQGIGVARYAFGDKRELGDPVVVYLFQGGRIARLAPRLTLDYEWNFGLSFGWHPYDRRTNRRNLVMGSKINACLDAGVQLDWRFAPRFSLAAGIVVTHFSNGNTKLPNAGLNTLGLRVGLTGELGPVEELPAVRRALPPFRRHVSYDVLLFGSWRRTGVALDGRMIASPEAYPVAGFNFAPMYAFGYRFRAGVSLDGVYDGSANVYTKDYIVEIGGRDPGYTFYKPSLSRQLALGLSARAEFVMPYFTINVGLGVNVLHKGGDLRAFYQILALKIGMTRSSYLHVGYCLKDFHMPNFLMLGAGYRFGDRTPRVR